MKQRILIVSKFYYPRGGAEIAAMRQQALLESRGHAVAVFAMSYPDNVGQPYSGSFASRVDFASVSGRLRFASRVLGYGGVRKAFRRVLHEFRPDVVHFHNIHSYLSPAVVEEARRYGARTVWTLHDYKLACPAYSCRCRGKVCVQCLSGKSAVIRRRCHKDSLAASILAWMEAVKWNVARIDRAVDCFICPSHFMHGMMESAGIDASKLVTVSNFYQSPVGEIVAADRRGSYYVYAGRLSDEKGVEMLIQAALQLPYELRVLGHGPLAGRLRELAQNAPNIRFYGQCTGDQVDNMLAHARFSVINSRCFENNPLSVIESLCAGTPVLGSMMGGIPELIGKDSGRLSVAATADDYAADIEAMWHSGFDHALVARQARERFSPAAHYTSLMKVYNNDI